MLLVFADINRKFIVLLLGISGCYSCCCLLKYNDWTELFVKGPEDFLQ